jgi:hypothetical protein
MKKFVMTSAVAAFLAVTGSAVYATTVTEPIYFKLATGEMQAVQEPIYFKLATGTLQADEPIYFKLATGETQADPIYFGLATGDVG